MSISEIYRFVSAADPRLEIRVSASPTFKNVALASQ